jgi:hypothetical protein
MLFLKDTGGNMTKFDTEFEAQEHIKLRHAEEGGFEWISEIKDDKGKYYGCNWKLEIVKI